MDENGRQKRERVESFMSHYSVTRSKDFNGLQPWEALTIASLNGTTVRLHWTDSPYHWHVNDGEEVFAVLDGTVEMHVREQGQVQIVVLNVGDVFLAKSQCEHVAHPRGVARILVVEKEGSE